MRPHEAMPAIVAMEEENQATGMEREIASKSTMRLSNISEHP